VLLTLGKAGVTGHGVGDDVTFDQPTDVAVARNGDVFVADGHGREPTDNARIVKFDKSGKFVKTWGKKGTAPGEFDCPHTLAFDSRGRLYVGDRQNNRIQIFDQEGIFIAEWKQFGRPSGIALRDGRIYVADSESNGVAPNPGWKRGIRVGELPGGRLLYRIPDPLELKGTSAAEGLAVDAQGNVFGGEVGPRQLVKHVIAGNR
jgi:DNA-binding beta-propeller fold protein YncE